MTDPPRTQFTIGRLMAITAILALLLAGSLGGVYSGGGSSWLLGPQFFVDRLIALSLIVVCARYLSLSRHMRWVVGALLAGFVTQILLLIMVLTGQSWYGNPGPGQIMLVGLQVFSRGLTIIYIWNLYQTFRDIQDRLTRAEARSKQSTGDAGLSDFRDRDGPFSPPRDAPP
jgi:hypothetical protein